MKLVSALDLSQLVGVDALDNLFQQTEAESRRELNLSLYTKKKQICCRHLNCMQSYRTRKLSHSKDGIFVAFDTTELMSSITVSYWIKSPEICLQLYLQTNELPQTLSSRDRDVSCAYYI